MEKETKDLKSEKDSRNKKPGTGKQREETKDRNP